MQIMEVTMTCNQSFEYLQILGLMNTSGEFLF